MTNKRLARPRLNNAKYDEADSDILVSVKYCYKAFDTLMHFFTFETTRSCLFKKTKITTSKVMNITYICGSHFNCFISTLIIWHSNRIKTPSNVPRRSFYGQFILYGNLEKQNRGWLCFEHVQLHARGHVQECAVADGATRAKTNANEKNLPLPPLSTPNPFPSRASTAFKGASNFLAPLTFA